LGRPTKAGNTALGASSPENPALVIPVPLSITTALPSVSDQFIYHSFHYFL